MVAATRYLAAGRLYRQSGTSAPSTSRAAPQNPPQHGHEALPLGQAVQNPPYSGVLQDNDGRNTEGMGCLWCIRVRR